MILPNGFDELIKMYGDPRPYLADGDDRDWQVEILTSIKLPFPLRYYWGEKDTEFSVSKTLRVHKLAADVFLMTLECLVREGLSEYVTHHGGAYNYRAKRGSSKLSTHVWALAHDLNPRTNKQGTPGDMNPDVIAVYEAHGWVWGGRWHGKSRDPMHMQLVLNY